MGFLTQLHELLPAGIVRTIFDVLLTLLCAWLAYLILTRAIGAIARRANARAESDASRQVVAAAFRVISGLATAGIIFVAGILVLDQLGITWNAAGPLLAGVVGTIAVAWVAFHIVAAVIAATLGKTRESIKRDSHRQRVATLLLLLRNFAKYVIMFAAGVMVLDQVGVDIGVVLAGAGIVGLAVGFGAQNLVRDIVTGFFIIIEGQYAVGDLVEINGMFGTVEGVGLRVTRLRDPSGQLRYVPNGTITRAGNYTAKCVAHAITIPLPSEDPDAALSLIPDALDDFDREFHVFAQPPNIGSAQTLATYARIVRVETRSRPGRDTFVEQKLPSRMAAALQRAGHDLPDGTEISVAPAVSDSAP